MEGGRSGRQLDGRGFVARFFHLHGIIGITKWKVEEAGDNSMEEDLSHSTVKRDFEDVSEESLLMKEAATILIGLHTFLKPIAENIPLVLPNSIDASSLTGDVETESRA